MESILLVNIVWFSCNKYIFSFKIWATSLFLSYQLDFIPSSCKNRSCLRIITCAETAGFTSGSPSFTSAEICFGHWSSGGLRKLGPLNHLQDFLDLIASRPLSLLAVCIWTIMPLSKIQVIMNDLNPVSNRGFNSFTWITDITKYYLWIYPEIFLINFNIQLFS